MLLVERAVQGISAASMMPTTMTLLKPFGKVKPGNRLFHYGQLDLGEGSGLAAVLLMGLIALSSIILLIPKDAAKNQ